MVRRIACFGTRIGWATLEEAPIPIWGGRVDLILQPRPSADTWIIEAKQALTSNQDLRDAITQAIGYRPFATDIWGPVTRTIVLAERIAPNLDTEPMASAHAVDVLNPPRLRHAMKDTERRIRHDLPAVDRQQERLTHLENMARQGRLAAAYYGQGLLSPDTLVTELHYLTSRATDIATAGTRPA
jgi:hypothetical protein